jgi:hypothetical protein
MGPKARARSKLRDPTPSPDSSPSGKGSDNDPDASLEIENFLADNQTMNATTLPTRQPSSHPNPLIRPRVPSGEHPDESQPTLSTTAPTSPMAPLPPKRSKRIVEKETVINKAKELEKGKSKANPLAAPVHPPPPFTFSSIPTYPIPRHPPTYIAPNSLASSSNAIPLQPPFIPIPPQPHKVAPLYSSGNHASHRPQDRGLTPTMNLSFGQQRKNLDGHGLLRSTFLSHTLSLTSALSGIWIIRLSESPKKNARSSYLASNIGPRVIWSPKKSVTSSLAR